VCLGVNRIGKDRIFTLRCLSISPTDQYYEFVEIPKLLMLKARDCELEVKYDSTQNPKPGYGHVYGENRELLYDLYFDGGTERKLQIKALSKASCKVHGIWRFMSKIL
jgi:Type II site-specific deoxyribonuclease